MTQTLKDATQVNLRGVGFSSSQYIRVGETNLSHPYTGGGRSGSSLIKKAMKDYIRPVM
ncbi:MAG: hypothetical protein HC803_03970 [Saprospiraceae bacterium]|nr:hypothetical protein [Saprospiraceae bacterium]